VSSVAANVQNDAASSADVAIWRNFIVFLTHRSLISACGANGECRIFAIHHNIGGKARQHWPAHAKALKLQRIVIRGGAL